MRAPLQAALQFPAQTLRQAQGGPQGMRLALFDVDGVLTDGRLYIGEEGEGFKAFHVLDGQGLKLLTMAGIEPVIITGRDSPALRRRLADLQVRHALYGISDKRAAAQEVLTQQACDWASVAAIGDDWPDLPVLCQAAFACAPPSAHAEVQARVHHITQAPAGLGAAREFCDLLLVAAGRYEALLQAQTQTLDAV
jgi:3-deoxy-D-manno-octulosonate 8-phosphate phosphatase (KDO 8-P phosphatase)